MRLVPCSGTSTYSGGATRSSVNGPPSALSRPLPGWICRCTGSEPGGNGSEPGAPKEASISTDVFQYSVDSQIGTYAGLSPSEIAVAATRAPPGTCSSTHERSAASGPPPAPVTYLSSAYTVCTPQNASTPTDSSA